MDKHEEILRFCATSNSPEFNRNKVIEEAGEFVEVILKLETKHPDNPKRPKKEDALKEFGDLQYRAAIYLAQLFPEMSFEDISMELDDHMQIKLDKLIEYRKEGKYGTGL